MDGCIFCRIASGSIRARLLFEDDELLAFHDLSPQAPVHVLVIPRRHIASLADSSVDDRELLGKLLLACGEVARRTGISDDGFRVVTNTGARSGQSVFHLHFHVIGGRSMRWPPG
ncbi:MAG: histidine triad nucleotide-binding protein [Acidobacteriota bacterium]